MKRLFAAVLGKLGSPRRCDRLRLRRTFFLSKPPAHSGGWERMAWCRQADANVLRARYQGCERQQREHLGPGLCDAAVTHLAIAELALLYGPAARCKPKVMVRRQ